MKSWNVFFMLLYCSGALCAPSEQEPTSTTTSTTVKNTDNNGSSGSLEAEDSVPTNMNIADYYYSIFGKHLDYDYREPLLTFEEPTQNELSDEILSEVDKVSDPWDTHSRRKRFIVVPSGIFNSTRRWVQQVRRLRMERRRLRTERRKQWQQNRIRYLQARSEALQKQATRLTQLQQRQQANKQVTRSVPANQQAGVHNIVVSIHNNSTAKPILQDSSNNATVIKSDPIPNEKVLTSKNK